MYDTAKTDTAKYGAAQYNSEYKVAKNDTAVVMDVTNIEFADFLNV